MSESPHFNGAALLVTQREEPQQQTGNELAFGGHFLYQKLPNMERTNMMKPKPLNSQDQATTTATPITAATFVRAPRHMLPYLRIQIVSLEGPPPNSPMSPGLSVGSLPRKLQPLRAEKSIPKHPEPKRSRKSCRSVVNIPDILNFWAGLAEPPPQKPSSVELRSWFRCPHRIVPPLF